MIDKNRRLADEVKSAVDPTFKKLKYSTLINRIFEIAKFTVCICIKDTIYLIHLAIILITSVKFRFGPPGNRKKKLFAFCTKLTDLKNQSNF